MEHDTLTDGTPTDAPRAPRSLLARISTIEWVALGIVTAVLLVLVALEPDILRAPFASGRSIAVVVGGTVLAAVAWVVMVRLGVPPVVRVVVLGVPFVVASWWLLSPFFVDDEVHDPFDTSIAAAQAPQPDRAAPPTTAPGAATPEAAAPTTTGAPVPTGPVLLGSGSFVGLAGHDGTGDAGIFELEDGSLVLRLENFDIDNGPDLKLYLVPGADRRSPADDAHFFGALRGNVGEQTYEIPSSFTVGPGPWTVLVWCEAFTVEFVAANVVVA